MDSLELKELTTLIKEQRKELSEMKTMLLSFTSEKYLNAKQAMDIMQVTRPTFMLYVKQGKIKPYVFDGAGNPKYKYTEILQLLKY